ncbi:MAG: DivIVA protein [Solirubrobacterales bacterium]|nr:DivIVA protein [Solirubrobacterales bacterium]
MALDRSFIEKRDFPTGRRGYDTAAVDEHLRAVAEEVQALRARADAAPPTTSAAASERVGAIIAAAEATAADIERSARDEAARIRAEAASGTSAEVEAVRAVATRLRERAEKLERELSVLVASVGELAPQAPVAPRVPEPEPSPAIAAAAAPDLIPIAPPVAPEPAAALAATRHAADAENARVVALSMALGGTPRAETDRYLAANYGGLPDREGLLDEVYASVGR